MLVTVKEHMKVSYLPLKRYPFWIDWLLNLENGRFTISIGFYDCASDFGFCALGISKSIWLAVYPSFHLSTCPSVPRLVRASYLSWKCPCPLIRDWFFILVYPFPLVPQKFFTTLPPPPFLLNPYYVMPTLMLSWFNFAFLAIVTKMVPYMSPSEWLAV